jgi:hypothetical protein
VVVARTDQFDRGNRQQRFLHLAGAQHDHSRIRLCSGDH